MRRAAILAGVVLAACGGDGTGPDGATIPAELVGTWEASPACFPACGFTFENVASAADTVNFTALGATSRFTLASSGNFTFDAGIPGVQAISGRVHAEGGATLVVEATATTPEERISYTRSGDILALQWQDTYSFNIDGVEGDEDVRVRGRFERQ